MKPVQGSEDLVLPDVADSCKIAGQGAKGAAAELSPQPAVALEEDPKHPGSAFPGSPGNQVNILHQNGRQSEPGRRLLIGRLKPWLRYLFNKAESAATIGRFSAVRSRVSPGSASKS